jgi:curved DNA-binding protein CbpA
MSFDPYAELDLPRTADTQAVKRAYRKRAKSAHPDAGGTAEAFSRASRAMLILTDPARREKFDRTGDADDVAPDNTIAVAVSIIVGYFDAAVVECVKLGKDACGLDMVGGAREHFKKQILAFENQKVPVQKAANALERVEKRLRSRKNANPIVRAALLAQVRTAQQPLRDLDGKIRELRDALALLEHYEFDIDPTQAVAPRAVSLGASFWSLA